LVRNACPRGVPSGGNEGKLHCPCAKRRKTRTWCCWKGRPPRSYSPHFSRGQKAAPPPGKTLARQVQGWCSSVSTHQPEPNRFPEAGFCELTGGAGVIAGGASLGGPIPEQQWFFQAIVAAGELEELLIPPQEAFLVHVCPPRRHRAAASQKIDVTRVGAVDRSRRTPRSP